MGAGPALVLIHGFPQDWFEWRRVMPRLAERFTVIAVDLRGVRRFRRDPFDGYDSPGLAEDVAQLSTRSASARRTSSGTTSAAWWPTRSPGCTRS